MQAATEALQLQVNEQGELVLNREQVREVGLAVGDQLLLMTPRKNQFFLVKIEKPKPISKQEITEAMTQAFRNGGYDSRQKIIELTREVKREMAQEW